MTLYETVRAFENIALEQPNIRSVGHNRLYDDMNATPSLKYRVFYLTQNPHKSNDLFDIYSFNAFVIDRLRDDKTNELEAESYAKETLDNILTKFCEMYQAELVGTRKYQPFTEKFADETCGMYVTFEVEVPKDLICPE